MKVESVNHVQGFTFHSGKIMTDNNSLENALSVNLNDQVICEVDSSQRYYTALNHTAVHLLNHSIRKYYNNELAIIQTGSQVKQNSFKFEFKFNEMLIDKLSQKDLSKIQSMCNELIQKKLPIYINENVNLESITENKKIKFPIRMLNDVLYPLKVRVVSVGTTYDNFSTGKFHFIA